jgi:hypothetical protein
MTTDNDGPYGADSGNSYDNADSATFTQPDSPCWFWSSSWQNWEREAEADLIAGRYEAFNTDSAFLASPGEPKRHVQPVLLFLPLALWRWLQRWLRG